MNVFKIIFLAALFAAGGCAPTLKLKPMKTPDGNQGFFVSCDGSLDDWSSCYAAATKACQGKYSLVDRNESNTPTQHGPLVRRNLIVECKK